MYRFGDYTLEVEEHRLKHGDREISLPPKTFETLVYLVERHGHLVTKHELLDALWAEVIVTENTLTKRIKELRQALEDNAQHPCYIETIHRVGYKFIAEVEEITEADPDEKVEEVFAAMRVAVSEEGAESAVGYERSEVVDQRPEPTTSMPGATTRPTRPQPTPASRERRPGVQVLAAGLALIGLTLVVYYSWPGQPEPPPIRSMAVLPFKPLVPESRDQVLELGLADTLITRLSSLRHVIVRPTSAVRRYTDLEQDPLVAGRELKVEAVLEGSLQRVGDQLRVTVRLLSVPDGASLWAYQCDERQCTDMFAVQDAISQEVAQALLLTLTGEEKQRLTKRYTENTEAYQFYLKGRYFWNKFTVEDIRKGIEYFRQAIEKDPGYALAYAGLAESYQVLAVLEIPPTEGYPRAKAAVAKALEIDDGLAEAHAALGWFRLSYDWDFPAARKEFQRAIEINPNAAHPHVGVALTLAARGRFNEALAKVKWARELDPVSLIINMDLGIVLYYARQYDLAIGQYRQTIEMDPNFPLAHLWLGRAYEKKGLYEEALTEYTKFLTLAYGDPTRIEAELEEASAVSGWTGFWQKELDFQFDARSKGIYIDAFWTADRYLHLGQKDQVIQWLQKAYDERSTQMVFLNVDPLLDSLRSDPRFHDLLRRIGLQ